MSGLYLGTSVIIIYDQLYLFLIFLVTSEVVLSQVECLPGKIRTQEMSVEIPDFPLIILITVEIVQENVHVRGLGYEKSHYSGENTHPPERDH